MSQYHLYAIPAFHTKNMKKRNKAIISTKSALFAGTAATLALSANCQAQSASATNPPAQAPAATGLSQFSKPAWLTDLSLGVKETYDDNIYLVSGAGMKPQDSFVTIASPKVGFNFAPLLGSQKTLQTLSLVYAPDFALYSGAPTENYIAHKINNSIKGSVGDFSFALDNAFLFNDGDKVAEIYALNQLGGGAANQLDKYRNNFAHAPARERRNQIQDRSSIVFQYDLHNFFIRPTASWVDYDLMTDWHNTGAAPWKGYQNYVSRYDVNGGLDLGYKVKPDLALLFGYRDGHQYQQRLPIAIDGDQHHADSDYQRLLVGVEGKPWTWLNVKLSGGPDFRYYNPSAPVNARHMTTFYAEGSLTATLSPSQSVTFSYKDWQWVSSTGKAPEFDSSYGLTYHWEATKQLGFDLGARYQQADFLSGNDFAGSAPSMRNDADYTISFGASYAFTKHFNMGLTYSYDMGRNLLSNYSAAPATTSSAAYRSFDHQLISLAAQYKF